MAINGCNYDARCSQLLLTRHKSSVYTRSITMRNLIFFTIATLLLSHVTWAGYWANWGVTCEPEDEIISVCGKATAVKKCRGTCRSLSSITMNFPWYETKCECCKASGWRLEVVHCKHGSKEEIFHAHRCSCKNCLGA